jgi:hypothetical protein
MSNKIQCPFFNECHAATDQPTADGWAHLSSWGPGIPDGWYCSAHADAIEQVLEAGGFEEAAVP